MAGKLIIPPNAKYQPQDPQYVSTETGSKDPYVMRSRVFVGCLNTDTVSREDVIQLFSMYGPLRGVSHFKSQGYGFVQFDNEEDAIDAVQNLNLYEFHELVLDVKIATPTVSFLQKDDKLQKKQRSKRGGRKERERRERAASYKGGYGNNQQSSNYVDYDEDIDGSPGSFIQSPANVVRPLLPSRAPAAVPPAQTSASAPEPTGPPTEVQDLTPNSDLPLPPRFKYQTAAEKQEGSVLNENEVPDVLICGGCHLITANAQFFLEHRIRECDRKIVMKSEDEPEFLKCYSCKVPCKNSWDLIYHMSQAHKLNLYNNKTTSTVEYPEQQQ
ncbi:unnamed protein product [Bursaphelenchus okinawaensis]|uniref:RRM domain-containing protein n=1 Tax=Bursaphelenchus okinawaensis TaxID=465554 RepID=A0A811JU72_9BILA|nr:unnamed protein product [Bursaphelenchus okinawaensis]CAG9082662.1 unnamed protein product [Bursaphelenchus okinawaensis]